MKSLRLRIGALRNLQDDWDSQGARAPGGAVIHKVEYFANLYIHRTDKGLVRAIPTADGGLALSALDCNGDEVNIELRPDGTWKLDG